MVAERVLTPAPPHHAPSYDTGDDDDNNNGRDDEEGGGSSGTLSFTRGSATGEGMATPMHSQVASRYAAPAAPKADSPEFTVRYTEEAGASFTRMNDNVATLLW